jgi:hypothetical protein
MADPDIDIRDPIVPRPELMPMPHSGKAPRFVVTLPEFDAFFKDIDDLALRARLPDVDIIGWALRYAGAAGTSWNFVECMRGEDAHPTWEAFKADVRKCYPHVSGERRYTYQELDALVRQTASLPDMTRTEFGDYYRHFLTYSTYLLERKRIAPRDQSEAYLRGFPPAIAVQIRERLRIKQPDVVPDDGYSFSAVHEAASFIFSGGTGKGGLVTPKTEPNNTPMRELVHAMSSLTRVFTASLQNQQRQLAPPPPAEANQYPYTAPPRFPTQQAASSSALQQGPARWSQPNPDQVPQNCIFCSGQGHFMRNCPSAEQYLQQGKIIRNSLGKLSLPDGSYPARNVPGKNMRERVDNWYAAQGIHQESSQEPVSTNYLEGPEDRVFAIDINPHPDQSPTPDPSDPFDHVQVLQAQIESLQDAQVLALQGKKPQFDGVEIMRRVGPPRREPPPPPPSREKPTQPTPTPTKPTQPAPNVSGKPGARPGARPQGPMRPVTFPTKPAAEEPKYRYQAPIEADVKTSSLADRALDAQITISARELLAASPEVRRHMKESVTNKKVSANLVETDPLDNFLTECFDSEPDPDDLPTAAYVDLVKYESSPSAAAASLPLRVVYPSFGNGIEPECILDGGAQMVVMRKDIWEQLRAPVAANKAIPMESANASTSMTLGLVENHPVQFGPITFYLQIQVVERAPFEVLLGRPFFDVASCEETSRSGGAHQIRLRDPKDGAPYVFPTYARPLKAHRENSSPANFHQ